MKHGSHVAFLLCNGEAPSRRLLRRLAQSADYVVAADGGANEALRAGIYPHTIVGDLDSIRAAARRKFSRALLIRIRRQDNTDLEKSLDFIAAQGIRRVAIAGITGRRIDFALANFAVLWKYARRLELEVIGDGWRAYPVHRKFERKTRLGATVSIIPFGPCSGVTLRGLKYPLRNAVLRVGDIGVSNVAVRPSFSVSVRRGHVLVVVIDRASRYGAAS